jgi:hypothetical protein
MMALGKDEFDISGSLAKTLQPHLADLVACPESAPPYQAYSVKQ